MNQKIAEKIVEENCATYNLIASSFGETRRKRMWQEVVDITQYIKTGDRVLDLGCGNGRLLSAIGDLSITYVGIDRCDELLNRAKRLYGTGTREYPRLFMQGDMRAVPFQTGSFDCVCVIASLHHFPSFFHRKIFEEAYRVLKQRGILLMTNFNLWKLSVRGKTVWKYFFKKPKLVGEWLLQDAAQFSYKDVITLWNGYPLYYYAFTLRELIDHSKEARFLVEDAYHAINGKRVSWWRGNNLVLIGKR